MIDRYTKIVLTVIARLPHRSGGAELHSACTGTVRRPDARSSGPNRDKPLPRFRCRFTRNKGKGRW